MVIGTDGIFNSDNEDQKRLGFNKNRVMPQTDIEYERDKLSNDPRYKVFSEGENSNSKENSRYKGKSNRTHVNNLNMQIYEDGRVSERAPSISTIGGGYNDTPSLIMP